MSSASNIIAVTAAQKKQGWDLKLREQSVVGDIFGDNQVTGGILRDKDMPTNAFHVKMSAQNGESKRTISLLKELSGTGLSGSATRDQLGQEEKQATQERWIYSEEQSHGVAAEVYGKVAFEKDPYQFYPQASKQLGRWHSRKRATRIRQALCEGYDLLIPGTNNQNGLTTSVLYPHRNIWVAAATNVVGGAQVAYSSTAATYGGSIEDAADSIADITSLSFFDNLGSQLQNAAIKPIEGIGAKAMWVITIPQRTANILRPLVRAITQYTSADRALSSEIGRFGNFILVEDNLAPRITTSEDAAAAFTYADPMSDGRTAAAAEVNDVGFILGAGAVLEFEQEAMHFENESQKYNRFKGIAAFSNYGLNRNDWDDAANTNSANRKNYTSGLVVFKSV